MSHIMRCVRSCITYLCTKFHTPTSHSSLDVAVKPNVKDLRNSAILFQILGKKCLKTACFSKTQSVDYPKLSVAPSSQVSAFGMLLLLNTKLEYIWFAVSRIQFVSRENENLVRFHVLKEE
jgi:hypothetical protein